MNETIKAVPISDIFIDYEWNCRSYAQVVTDVSDGVQDTTRRGEHSGEGLGFSGLMTSLHENGQDQAVIIRKVENGVSMRGIKTACPYELVCGFRRITAIIELGKKGLAVGNAPKATVRAIGRMLSAVDARKLNIRENTERHGLTTPDMVKLIGELSKTGLNQVQIAKTIGVSANYVCRLYEVAKLPALVLAHWRGAAKLPGLPNRVFPQLTAAQMINLAYDNAGKTTDQLVRAYIELVMPEPGNHRQRIASVHSRIVSTAELVAGLVQLGFLKPGTMKFGDVIGPKGDGYPVDSGRASAEQRQQLCRVFEQAYEKALKGEK